LKIRVSLVRFQSRPPKQKNPASCKVCGVFSCPFERGIEQAKLLDTAAGKLHAHATHAAHTTHIATAHAAAG